MEIHGLVYLVVGGVVIGVTTYVQNANPEAQMVLFFWAGILMLAWGAFKIIKNLILKGADKEIKTNTPKKTDISRFGFNKDLNNLDVPNNLAKQKQMLEQQMSGSKTTCIRCRATIPAASKFCTYCGTRQK